MIDDKFIKNMEHYHESPVNGSSPNLKESYLEFLAQVHEQEYTEKYQAYNQALGQQIIASLETSDRLDMELDGDISQLSLDLNRRSAWRRRKAEKGLSMITDILAEEDEEFSLIREHFENCQDELWQTINRHNQELNQIRERISSPLALKTRWLLDEVKLRLLMRL